MKSDDKNQNKKQAIIMMIGIIMTSSVLRGTWSSEPRSVIMITPGWFILDLFHNLTLQIKIGARHLLLWRESHYWGRLHWQQRFYKENSSERWSWSWKIWLESDVGTSKRLQRLWKVSCCHQESLIQIIVINNTVVVVIIIMVGCRIWW